jgi:hypothetical protein
MLATWFVEAMGKPVIRCALEHCAAKMFDSQRGEADG